MSSNLPGGGGPNEPLHYANVLSTLARALRLEGGGDGGNAPERDLPRNRADLAAATVHAAMVALGFRLLGLGDEGGEDAGDGVFRQIPLVCLPWTAI